MAEIAEKQEPPSPNTTTSPRTIAALDWENDPRNARNWPTTRKIGAALIVSAIGFVSTFAASIYASGHEDVAAEFHISSTLALLPLSFYNLGMAFGPMIASPMSETFGRKAVYLTTTPLFALFILGSGFSQNLASLIICRFFAGLFGAPGVSIASATIADTTPPHKRGQPLAAYYSIPYIGSLFGPLIGNFVVSGKGWRWTQWTVLFFAVSIFPLLAFVRESYRKTIVQRIAQEENLEIPQTTRSPSKIIRNFLTTTVTRPVHMLITEPIVSFVCLYCAFQFALLYTFVIAAPYVFGTVYGFSLNQQGLSFLGFIVGGLFAPLTIVLFDRFKYQKKYREFVETYGPGMREVPPEPRLYPSMVGSIILPTGLFLFAWTARPSIHWICPLVACGITMCGSILAYVGANMYMVDTYGPLYGASAAGANSLARYTLSAAFPLFTLQMYRTLGVDWATSLLGFCTVAMAPIPWVFHKWGPKLRARSKYEREM
ncbi:MFS general substrate transporter [Rhizodiscina lignyota]|uniref:MFS general substrate transporter n=1 Tax=Rhizodiscina lignyota TaxID=1504668 RepID=A0A9P4M6Z6_9PEZI|nr:MFS general substrate transporter [Rhizodiscina lignyota]